MRYRVAAVAIAAAVAGACSSEAPTRPGAVSVPLLVQSDQHQGEPHHYGTHLTGNNEVPVRDTRGQGQATFKLNDDGTELSYKLNVANIENVTQAHIHLGAVGFNGGIVAWLYPSAPPSMLIPGRTQGTLGEGVITAANLTGTLAGQTLEALLDRIQAGGAYVNVHTSQFPGGEIRGQIR